jgi:tetratricopeptide (TPR) repeat protein
MNTDYIIFEDSVHAQVFLVQANSEEQAWKLYLERERNYVEQSDGTYRSGPWTHGNLQDVFQTYGIVSRGDGSYFDTEGATFQSLDDVRAMYGIEERSDETFVSYDKSYPNLTEALRQTVGHHRFEIAPCSINPLAAFQTLFVSKDKWDYVEQGTSEDLKSDIATQHLWQAERYKTLGQLEDAVAELKKALNLAASRKEKLDILLGLGWLLRSLGQFSAAVKNYREALHIATEYDNEAWIRQRLAEVYEEMGQPSKALWHYRRVLVDDLDDADTEKLQERITELSLTV